MAEAINKEKFLVFDAEMAKNALFIILSVVFVAIRYWQYSAMWRDMPMLADFQPVAIITGKFTISYQGRHVTMSSLNGQPIYRDASHYGAGGGFGSAFGIPNGSVVTASIAKVNTQSGVVWVALSIKNNHTTFVSKTPNELLNLWISQSKSSFSLESMTRGFLLVSIWIIIVGTRLKMKRGVQRI